MESALISNNISCFKCQDVIEENELFVHCFEKHTGVLLLRSENVKIDLKPQMVDKHGIMMKHKKQFVFRILKKANNIYIFVTGFNLSSNYKYSVKLQKNEGEIKNLKGRVNNSSKKIVANICNDLYFESDCYSAAISIYKLKSNCDINFDIDENKEFWDNMECSWCDEYLIPPVSQCQYGHAICGLCAKIKKMCTICNNPFNSKNTIVDSIIKNSMVCCRYDGCDVKISVTDMGIHEHSHTDMDN